MSRGLIQKSVLLVLHTLKIGGTERQVYLLATGLQKRGWKVEVYSFEKRGDYKLAFESAGVTLHTGKLHGDQSAPVKAIVLMIAQLHLIWLLLSRRFQVVQAFLPLPNFIASLAGRITFTPLVITSKRNTGAHQDRFPLMRWVDKISNGLSHEITANAKAIASDAKLRDNCNLNKFTIIPNGLIINDIQSGANARAEIRNALKLSPQEVAICYVASISPRKAHRDLVAAFAQVLTQEPHARLFLIGEERGVQEELITQITDAGISHAITFMGKRDDVSSLLAGMDIGVMVSHEEGLSNALLEKLAAGLLIVATDVGGNCEALEGMPDCYIVPPRNIDAIATGLINAVHNIKADGDKHAIRQVILRQRYSVPKMLDAYEELYMRNLS